jgi:hypothetical protein
MPKPRSQRRSERAPDHVMLAGPVRRIAKTSGTQKYYGKRYYELRRVTRRVPIWRKTRSGIQKNHLGRLTR